jgi:N-acyl-D-amino-acid deacylase
MAAMRYALVLALAMASAAVQPQPAGILLTNGTVVDGSGSPGRAVSVRIRGDRIVEVAAGLTASQGEQVIDASGLTIAPGFIDVHSHADRGIDDSPGAGSQVLQGITTAVVGQDGGSSLPVSDFFERVEMVRPAINYASSIGHGSVRGVVMGSDFKRAATTAEIETMKALVERGMLDGALGLSSGLEYDPGFYSKPDELVALARVAARHGGFYSSHVRDEENGVFDAWREAIDVGRKAGLPVEISHIKLASKPVWGKSAEAVKILEDAKRQGLNVTADWYPYTYWQSSMYVLIPDRDFENRAKWQTGLDEIGGAGNVLVTGYRPDPSWNGRTVEQIAQSQNKDAVTTIIEMIRAAGPNIGIIGTSMTDEDLARFFAHPQVIICSDGGLSGRHPRGYGAFPRVLGQFVRERKLASIEEAIAKMTSRTAARIGMPDRGVIAAGKYADIVVFDAATIVDRGTPQEPSLPPIGMHHVFVNGEAVLRDGQPTSARPGRALRRVTAR